MTNGAVRGLIAGVAAFAVGSFLYVLLQGMTAGVRAASCGVVGVIVAGLVLMYLPGGGGPGPDADGTGTAP